MYVSYAILIIIVTLPIIIGMFIYQNFEKLDDPSIGKRLGEPFESLNKNKLSILLYQPIFMFRRLIFVLAAIYLSDYGFL